MPSVKIDINYDDAQIAKALRQLQEATGNLKPVFEDIGEYLDLSHRERWDREEAPDGTPWEPLSPRYRARKLRKKKPDKILVYDQQLRDTLSYRATRDSLEFGSNLIYAASQHLGREEIKLPARPWLGVSEADRDGILAIIGDHFQAALLGS